MICHQYKCIFIHIPKNAGQSIEHLFLNSLGLNWKTRSPLLLKKNDHPELGPPRLAHLKAPEYVSCHYLTQELYDQYYKFTFVRNPWSRMVSLYRYLGFDRSYSFRDFLAKKFIPEIFANMYWFVCPQSDFIYSKSGELLVDYVGRFEILQKDFDKICKEIGFSTSTLPHINRSVQKKKNRTFPFWGVNSLFGLKKLNGSPSKRSYLEYYDRDTQDMVAEIYRKDIEMFDYSFEQCIAG